MKKQIKILKEATIRFAGDSGDGMQLVGTLFALTSGSLGNSVNSFPDYPSEIRAPEGTLYGVSAYQLSFGSSKVNTPGDKIDVLVAMNASSLKVNLKHLREGGIVIANTAGFDEKNLNLAKYEINPLLDESITNRFKFITINISNLVKDALAGAPLSPKAIERTKNIFALGICYWLFDKSLDTTKKWLTGKFGKKKDILDGNLKVLEAGWKYAESSDLFPVQFQINQADVKPGFYRNITGNEAVAIGLVVASQKAKLPLFLGSYPITPATEILHHISGYKRWGVKHLQAEDEIGGICSAIGASFSGHLAVTTTSGPGLSLKVEAMGLAVILELPLIIVDVQRGGPSTGLPTKPEQSDLLFALFGRHGEAPLPVIAATSASDCFTMTLEAARIALKYMTPVILLTDGYLAQGAEPWRVPQMEELADIPVKFVTEKEGFAPYNRDPLTLARPWAIPGTPGLEHRIGGLEKENITGIVSQEPKNHQRMSEMRKAKIDGIANDIPLLEVDGAEQGDLLIVGWGGSYGAIKDAVEECRAEGKNVSYVHLKYLNPLPKNFGDILKKFKRILVAELNLGQLAYVIQANYMLPVLKLNKIQGMPFKALDIKTKLDELL